MDSFKARTALTTVAEESKKQNRNPSGHDLIFCIVRSARQRQSQHWDIKIGTIAVGVKGQEMDVLGKCSVIVQPRMLLCNPECRWETSASSWQ